MKFIQGRSTVPTLYKQNILYLLSMLREWLITLYQQRGLGSYYAAAYCDSPQSNTVHTVMY